MQGNGVKLILTRSKKSLVPSSQKLRAQESQNSFRSIQREFDKNLLRIWQDHRFPFGSLSYRHTQTGTSIPRALQRAKNVPEEGSRSQK